MRLNWNPPDIKPVTAEYTWSEPYSVIVALGVELKDGSRAKGRDWTAVAISRTDLPQLMRSNYRGNVKDAFIQTAEDLGEIFKDIIDNFDFGLPSTTTKRFRPGVPTWGEITDSGALRNSQSLEIRS